MPRRSRIDARQLRPYFRIGIEPVGVYRLKAALLNMVPKLLVCRRHDQGPDNALCCFGPGIHDFEQNPVGRLEHDLVVRVVFPARELGPVTGCFE